MRSYRLPGCIQARSDEASGCAAPSMPRFSSPTRTADVSVGLLQTWDPLIRQILVQLRLQDYGLQDSSWLNEVPLYCEKDPYT